MLIKYTQRAVICYTYCDCIRNYYIDNRLAGFPYFLLSLVVITLADFISTAFLKLISSGGLETIPTNSVYTYKLHGWLHKTRRLLQLHIVLSSPTPAFYVSPPIWNRYGAPLCDRSPRRESVIRVSFSAAELGRGQKIVVWSLSSNCRIYFCHAMRKRFTGEGSPYERCLSLCVVVIRFCYCYFYCIWRKSHVKIELTQGGVIEIETTNRPPLSHHQGAINDDMFSYGTEVEERGHVWS